MAKPKTHRERAERALAQLSSIAQNDFNADLIARETFPTELVQAALAAAMFLGVLASIHLDPTEQAKARKLEEWLNSALRDYLDDPKSATEQETTP